MAKYWRSCNRNSPLIPNPSPWILINHRMFLNFGHICGNELRKNVISTRMPLKVNFCLEILQKPMPLILFKQHEVESIRDYVCLLEYMLKKLCKSITTMNYEKDGAMQHRFMLWWCIWLKDGGGSSLMTPLGVLKLSYPVAVQTIDIRQVLNGTMMWEPMSCKPYDEERWLMLPVAGWTDIKCVVYPPRFPFSVPFKKWY